jgi:endoglucanase
MLRKVWGGTQAGNQGKKYKPLPISRANSLARALVCAVLLLCAAGAPASAQVLPDIYPDAVPLTPQPPAVGPVPDLPPVRGQDRTPRSASGCVRSGLPAGVPGVDARGIDPNLPNPLRGLRWYVDPVEPAYRSYRTFLRKGRRGAASLMWRIAREPRFRWFGRWNRPVARRVREYLRCVAAEQPGAVPLMVVMRHQGKGCGGYTGGGPAEDARTRAWYRNFARAVGGARVIIGFEPDSLGTVDCLAPSRRDDRIKTLAYGVDVLSQLPNATIYLEAGASDWEPAARTAKQLRRIGISKVRGFMLNATHHDWTRNNIRHGLDISRRVGGKPFIINTSYNGRGPLHYRNHRRRTINVWCHPPNRGLGIRPTTRTDHPKVDAYMYINRPGYSAGACNGGPLPVGSWWPERALMYARLQTDWLAPPRGTKNGFSR